MKNAILALCLLTSAFTFAQKAEIFEQNGLFGLRTDFGKELLPTDYTRIREIKTDTLDYYLAETKGSGELYSYNLTKRSIYNETQNEKFTGMDVIFDAAKKGKVFYGYDKVGNKYLFTGANWEQQKTKGDFIGGKNADGKYAVCQKGAALTDYIYDGVNNKFEGVIQVKTADGWQALDTKLKPIHTATYDELWVSKTHVGVYVIKKGKNWGFFSADGSFSIPLIPLRNAENIFKFDGFSYGNLARGFAYAKDGKYGIINSTGKEVLPFQYDNAFAFDPKEVERNGISSVAVAKSGTSWKFFDAKYKEIKSIEFDSWLALVGFEALVIKGGKMQSLNLKTFEFERTPYFNDWDYNTSVATDDGHQGLVSPKGDVIIGFENNQVHVAYEGTANAFVIVQKNGKDGIYDMNGTLLVEPNYPTLYELCVSGDKHYFAMGKNNVKMALVYWDKEKKTIVNLTEAVYKSINCYGKVESGFSATTLEGEVVNIKPDGTIAR